MNWKEVVISAPRSVVGKAVEFCDTHSCMNCPIYTNDLDHRTEDDKCEFVPCVNNLIYELTTHPHYKLY